MVKVTQTNPQAKLGMENSLSAPSPQNKAGMEVFLSSSPQDKQTQTKATPPQQTTKNQNDKIENQNDKIENQNDKIEKMIKEIERLLDNKRILELSQFNKIVHEKNLTFKVLFITSKIYVVVTDGQKFANIAVNPPRWGGSSLRYLVSDCIIQWCTVEEKTTSRGKMLSYKPVLDNSDNDNDDIFD